VGISGAVSSLALLPLPLIFFFFFVIFLSPYSPKRRRNGNNEYLYFSVGCVGKKEMGNMPLVLLLFFPSAFFCSFICVFVLMRTYFFFPSSTIGKYVRDLLLQKKYYNSMLPSIPIPAMKEIERIIKENDGAATEPVATALSAPKSSKDVSSSSSSGRRSRSRSRSPARRRSRSRSPSRSHRERSRDRSRDRHRRSDSRDRHHHHKRSRSRDRDRHRRSRSRSRSRSRDRSRR